MAGQTSEERRSVQIRQGLSNIGRCFILDARHAAAAGSLGVLSLLGLLLGFFGPGFIQSEINRGIRDGIVWQPHSPEPVDIRFRGACDPADPRALFSNVTLYLYNLTNLDEVRGGGAKPKMALVGPYRALRLECKLDVWWDSRGFVSAKSYVRYLPYPGGPLPGDADPEANVTTLNLALAGVVEAIHSSVGPSSAAVLDLVVSILAGWKDARVSGLFVHRTARELLWGYEDPLLVRLKELLPPGKVPRTRIQLVANMSEGASEALASPASLYDTGVTNLTNVWQVLEDKEVSAVTAWPGEAQGQPCPVERVRGTDGLQFRPGLKCTRDRLRVWMSALFRGTELVCAGARNFHGIKLLRYWPEHTWTAPDPCKEQSIAGLLNITTPMAAGPRGGADGNGTAMAAGARVYVSRPHFCGCDPSLRAGVEGLAPCADLDEKLSVWLDVEPLTGITMRASQPIMVSSEVTEAALQHLEPRWPRPSPVLPILWSQEHVEATPEMAAMFVRLVYGARRLKEHMHLWPLLFAVACASACACVLVHASFQRLDLITARLREQDERERQERHAIIQRTGRRASQALAEQQALQNGNGAVVVANGAAVAVVVPVMEGRVAEAEETAVAVAAAAAGSTAEGQEALRQPLLAAARDAGDDTS